MITMENIVFSLKTEVYEEENNFSDAQRTELSNILNSIDTKHFSSLSPLKILKNIRSYKDSQNKINKFEDLYMKYGGKKERLEAVNQQIINVFMKMIGVKI